MFSRMKVELTTEVGWDASRGARLGAMSAAVPGVGRALDGAVACTAPISVGAAAWSCAAAKAPYKQYTMAQVKAIADVTIRFAAFSPRILVPAPPMFAKTLTICWRGS